NKIKLVLQAHNHNIFVLKPEDGITYVCVGSGGRKAYSELKADSSTEFTEVGTEAVLHGSVSGATIKFDIVSNRGQTLFSKTIA
ncbi:MAG: hypothetical protein R3321_07090, partial [Nitrososphaeraceae archaeon]|nr:hypothetical protein [Nitrososphaeraceae archaeon]